MARTLDPTKKAAILKAARTILLRDGYTTAKMSDIAVEAGVAPGTLYVYFESKEALAGALAEECLGRLTTESSQVIKKLVSPDGVDALLNWSLRIGISERHVLALLKQSKPNIKSPQARDQFVQQLSESLTELMTRGVIRKYDEPTDLAHIVLAIMHRVIMSPVLEDSDPEQVKTSAVKALQHVLFDDVTLKNYWARLAE